MPRISTALSLAVIAGFASCSAAQIALLQSFDPAESGSINSLGYDSVTEMVYVHTQGGITLDQYDRAGTFTGTVTKPFPGGNDDDIEFTDVAVTLAGVTVPAGTLFSIEHDNNPPRIYAVDASDSSILATVNTDAGAVGSWVGGAYSKARGTFFCIDWTGDRIQEIDPADGAVLNDFTVVPTGAIPFDVFFGDVDVLDSDGYIYLVSSTQDRVRVLGTDGVWFGDLDLGVLGISGMSGIGFDDARSEAWIGSTNGTIYQFSGFTGIVPCAFDLADDSGNPLVRDFQITFGDFLALLGLIGPCPGGNPGCTGDIADNFGFPGADGVVGFGDFLFLLGQIGPC